MSNKLDHSMSLAKPEANNMTTKQKIGVFIGTVGFFILILALFNTPFPNKGLFLTLSLALIAFGTVVFANDLYLTKSEGIKNDGTWFKSISSRGILGWGTGLVLTGFYIVLYFFPEYLGQTASDKANTGLISLFDPLSELLSGRPASQWFVYGTLYTLAILIFGYKFLLKYRHNRYEQIRTISVMFFQLAFAFLIPEFMYLMNSDLPYYDFRLYFLFRLNIH